MIIIQMAWRNIWRNRMRSLIIMVSVALGLVAGLFVLSLYKGIMADRVRQVIETEVGHIQLHHRSFKEDFDPKFVIPDADKVIGTVAATNDVRAFSERTVSHGMIATGTGSAGIEIAGIQPEKENLVSGFSAKLVEGDGFSSTKKKNQVVIGRKLADKMHLKLNAKLVLTFTDQESNIISAAFRVSGIYQTENGPLDERIVYVQQTDLNRLLSMENQFHELVIILDSDDHTETVKSAFLQLFPDLQVESWKEISPETKLMIDTTDQYSDIFIIIIMLALSFGIINSMLMGVLERSREIGMLLAIGMNRLKIFYMILTETIFLTLTGAPAGILITVLIVQYYATGGLDISALGGEAMSSFGFSSMIYPAFPWEKLIQEMMIVIVAALLSAIFPAIRAIRLQPVEALQK